MPHTTDMHNRFMTDDYCEGDEIVRTELDKENCEVCLAEHLDVLDQIRRFAPIATKIEKLMRQYRDGIILPWEVTDGLALILHSLEA